MTVEGEQVNDKIYPVPARLLNDEKIPKPFISSFEQYQAKWKESVEDTDKFFGDVSLLLRGWQQNWANNTCIACS